MKKKEGTTSDPGWIVYEGPHPQVTLKFVPEIGEITLDRGKAVKVSEAVATLLMTNKTVVGAAAPRAEEKKSEDGGGPAVEPAASEENVVVGQSNQPGGR